MQGRVTNVTEHVFGSELATAASATDTSLDLVDLADFDFEGGTLTIGGTEEIAYTIDPDSTGTVDLATPLAASYDAETPVLIGPADSPTIERLAYFLSPDQEEELVARVPLRWWDTVALGTRADDESAEVIDAAAFDEGDLVLIDVLGTELDVDGSFVDEGTIPLTVTPDSLVVLDNFNRADGDPGVNWRTFGAFSKPDIADGVLVSDAVSGAGDRAMEWKDSLGAFAVTVARVPNLAEDPTREAQFVTYLELDNDDGSVFAGFGVAVNFDETYTAASGGTLIDCYTSGTLGGAADRIVLERMVEVGDQFAMSYDGAHFRIWHKPIGEDWSLLLDHEEALDPMDHVRLWVYRLSEIDDFRGDVISTTDGLPPDSSPTPTLRQGVGAIVVNFTPIANADPVSYELHVGTSSGFTPSGSTLVDGDAAGLTFVRHEPDGDPLDYATGYYVKVVAYDDDGAASPSSAAGPISPGQVDTPDVVPNSITAELLEAVMVISTLFKTAASGQRVEFDSDGIRLYASDGTTVLVNIPTDGSDPSFAGHIDALGLDLEAGTTATPPDDSRVRWVRTSDGAAVAQMYGSEISGESHLTAVATDPDTNNPSRGNFGALDSAGGGALLRVTRDADASPKSKVDFDLGTSPYIGAMLLDDLGNSQFIKGTAPGASGHRMITRGTFSIVVGAATNGTSGAISHGIKDGAGADATPTAVVAVVSRTLNAGNTKWHATVGNVGSTTFDIGVRSSDESNAGGTISGYWIAYS